MCVMKSDSKKDDSDTAKIDRRCACGQLLARLTIQGVELKCKRCRRVHVVPWRPVL
jgi:hypothetical protein